MKPKIQRNQIMAYCLAAAAPLLFMAVIFNFSLVFNSRYIFWTNQEILGYIIQAEFLAVASGVLVVLPLIIKTNNTFMRVFRFLLYAIVVVIFAWLSYDIDGIAGMLFIAYWCLLPLVGALYSFSIYLLLKPELF